MKILVRRFADRMREYVPGSKVQSSKLDIYDDDTFIVSYPRSGSTWLRRLLSFILNPEIEPSLANIENLIPDIHGHPNRVLSAYARPRILKSHVSHHPAYPRVLYLVRDGRDVAVSYYDFYLTAKEFGGSFSEFLALMLRDDRVGFGAWHKHVRSWVAGHGNIPFSIVKYEDLISDGIETLKIILDFLKIKAEDSRIAAAYEKCTFSFVQKDVIRNSRFFEKGYRGGVKGGPGAWVETFSDADLRFFWEFAGGEMESLGYPINPTQLS